MIGPIDLHLFGEGNHRKLWEFLGAHADPLGGVTFSVWAPRARQVAVTGDFNEWNDDVDLLEPQGTSGIWSGTIGLAQAGNRYKFVIDGSDGVRRWKADPMARQTQHPPDNASVVATPTPFDWSDEQWITTRDSGSSAARPLRIYEVHLGSWRVNADGTPLGYRQMGDQLSEYVAGMGFTHVELLPVAEHPYSPSWGYQVSGYFAPTARFGTPDDFRYLVDALHAKGVGVILDWVPAHFPKDEWSLGRFDGQPLYEHPDPRRGEQPDWGTYVFDYGRNEVRNFLVANALYWFHEFHLDGLRVDAVASMLYLDYSRGGGQWVPNRHGGRENLEAIDFLRQLNSIVFHEVPGALMIAEESTSWPLVTHRADHGGLGFSHKWNMGWMHDTLGYFASDPIHRRWHHRDLTFGLLYAFTERFVLPLSHDEVVHLKAPLLGKMSGDEWQQFANLRALYAWMWAYPGAPLLFMGGELAQTTEWNADLGLPWHLLDDDRHRGVQRLVTTLNGLDVAWPTLWERDNDPGGFQWLDADDAVHSIYAFARWSNKGDIVICVANFTPVPRPGYRVGLPWAGEWTVLLNTDLPEFGGSNAGPLMATITAGEIPYQGRDCSLEVDLPPLGVVWLAANTPG